MANTRREASALLWSIVGNQRTVCLLCVLVMVSLFTWLMPEVQVATLNYSTSSGLMSVGSNWSSGTSPCTTGGDGIYVSVQTAMTFDCASLGSSATGLQRLTIEKGGSINSYDGTHTTACNTSTQGSQTIWLNSTGTNAIGSGSTTNPGSDATEIGIFNAYGTFCFKGDVNDQLTVESATAGKPVYYSAAFDAYNAGTGVGTGGETGGAAQSTHGAAYICYFCIWKYAGASGATASIGEGFNVKLRAVETTPANSFDMENFELDSPYELVENDAGATNNGSLTIANGWLNGPTGAHWISWAPGATCATGLSFTNITETGATTTGQTAYFNPHPCGLTWTGNVTVGPSGSVQRGQLQITAATPVSGTMTITGNLVLNAEGTVASTSNAFDIAVISGDSTSTISNNIAWGSYQGIHVTNPSGSAVSPIVSNDWCGIYKEATAGQGCFETSGYFIHISNGIAISENKPSSGFNIGTLCYSGAGGTGVCQFDNMTLYDVDQTNTTDEGINLGDSTGSAQAIASPSYIRSSIIDGYATGLVNNTVNAYSTGGIYSVGPSNNLVLNAGNCAYQGASGNCTSHGTGSGYDDGTHYHPSAQYYGDLPTTVNPLFVDPTRRPTGYAVACGGTGTLAAMGTMYSYRDGLGAGSYNPCFDIPNELLWLQLGLAPRNFNLVKAGYGGSVQVGAVPVVATTPFLMWQR